RPRSRPASEPDRGSRFRPGRLSECCSWRVLLLSLRRVLLSTQTSLPLFLDDATFDRATDQTRRPSVDETAARLRLDYETAERGASRGARADHQRLRGSARALQRSGRPAEAGRPRA